MNDPNDIADQHRAMREAIAKAVLNWSFVEDSLARLLGYLLDKNTANQSYSNVDMIGFVIYFKPNNTETRIGIVDSVVRFFMDRPRNTERLSLLACWLRIYSKVNKIKERRNAVMHGSVATHAIGSNPTRNYVRLTHSLHDVTRTLATMRDGQVPGKSAHDVDAVADNFAKWANFINRFRQCVIAQEVYEDVVQAVLGQTGDPKKIPLAREASQQAILQLEADLKVTPRQ